MGMCVAVTFVLPAFFAAATKASFSGARPSSEVITRIGRVASFGALVAKSHWAWLAMISWARLSGVQPASGAMPSAANEAAIDFTASSSLDLGGFAARAHAA